MILTEDYVRKTIEEVAPLVEEITDLKCNLDNCKIRLKPFINKTSPSGYHPHNNCFDFRESFPGNYDYFCLNLGHELMHNAQYNSFKELSKKRNLSIHLDPVKYALNGDHPLEYLIEGDAVLVQSDLQKTYYNHPMRDTTFPFSKFLGIPQMKSFHKEEMPMAYKVGEEKLREKTKGDREIINSLYEYPLEKLIKFFDLKY